MKILFIGDANSFLIHNLAVELKKRRQGLTIDILTPEEPVEKGPFDDVFVIGSLGSGLGSKKYVKELLLARQISKALKKIDERYDALHFLYVSATYRLVWKQLSLQSDRIILSIFGSDFYRVGKLMKSLIGKELKSADRITFSNEKTLNDVQEYYSLDRTKLSLCYFGLVILDEIDKVNTDDLERFRQVNSIPLDKKLIACSSNASPNQNIGKIAEALCSNKTLIEKVHLSFQLHNIRTQEIDQALSKLKAAGYSYTIIDGRLEDHELAAYRKLADVMLQLQTTDQFSGAMQEHLYAGSIVITGEWLKYDILDQGHVDYIKISSFDELPSILERNLNKEVNSEINRSVIGKISKWSNTIDQWINLYER